MHQGRTGGSQTGSGSSPDAPQLAAMRAAKQRRKEHNMSMPITVIGNLTADPENVPTTTGTLMATFTVAETTRKPDGQGGFKDGNASFYRVRCFNGHGANVLNSLHKGDRVVVQGDLEIVRRQVETDGVTQWYTDASILANEVGVSLRFAKVNGIEKTSGPRSQAQAPVAQAAAAEPTGYLDDEAALEADTPQPAQA